MIAMAMVVLVLVVVGGAVVVAAASAVAQSGSARFPVVAAVVAGGAVVMLGLGALLLTFGISRGADGGSPSEGPVAASPDPSPRQVERREVVGSPAAFAVTARVDALRGELQPPFVVDGVSEGDVVLVSGRGFVPLARGRVAQCDGYAARRCENVIDVQTDDAGGFDLPYRVGDTASVLVVDVLDRRTGVTFARPTPAALKVGRDVADQPLAVAVTAPADGAARSLLACPYDGADLSVCSVAGPVSGSTTVSVPASFRTGDDVLVLVDASGTPITVARSSRPISATTGSTSGPDLDPRRVSIGLVLAFALVAGGVVLFRRTDWRPPAELSVEED